MSAAPHVSIVIRCRNEAAHLGAVLLAIAAQDDAPPLETIVLDSGSTDGTLTIVGRFPVRLETLPADAFSFGGALNRGAALARGTLLVTFRRTACPARPAGWPPWSRRSQIGTW